ncbi:beta-lactamase superfamily II metal-dependent hydrolase [Orenia metallireducens]|uniref:Metal-dependent hydrolase, beta-lactamase superfamily II n=1 Tax=Orenia metallireducens TaxID=1413210 RepID=A0A285IDD7_9FIRM|nr:MBL fold metallo-hydrolase [Orenia metallireducens]PRX19650.1 beta-lactamase superfamily II metal-dependent hydrolase [Orenia metallireducens]SNY45994.1 Metal-dependent hydrolase, beta-lactamase superfamily II [Orenia metallireducens]
MSNYQLVIDFLRVGFGECSCLRLVGEDSTFTILVDGGDNDDKIYQQNPKRIRVSEYLKEEGIEQIDLLVLTHFHRDHIGGIVEIIGQVEIKEAWLNYNFKAKQLNQVLKLKQDSTMGQSLLLYQKILQGLTQQETKVTVVNQDISLKIKDLEIKALAPSKEILDKLDSDMSYLFKSANSNELQAKLLEIDRYLNSASIPLKLSFGERSLLLTADLPLANWDDFKDQNLTADLLTAPHHGDLAAISLDLLESIKPAYFIICADNEGTYGLPNEGIEELIKDYNQNIKICYTENPDLKRANDSHLLRFLITAEGEIANKLI